MRALPDYLPKGTGERARLIPVVADTSKEQRATSALLASLDMVDEYGRAVLDYIGAPVRKTSRIETYTEVSFVDGGKERKLRPDGLVAIRTGKKIWIALIEAKIGNSNLDAQQVDEYVDLARAIGANAVVTISNQFASRSFHHPISINKGKLRSLELHHWSWGYLLTEAVLYVDHRGVSDPDQARVLSELARFLRHSGSGVVATSFMPTEWKDICAAARQESGLTRSTPGLTQCVERWHELVRSIALQLSMDIGRGVDVHLSRQHEKDPKLHLTDDLSGLVSTYKISAALNVPDAAGRLHLVADLARRTLTASMDLTAPQDKSRATASITWLKRQLESADTSNLLVSARWPGHTPDSIAIWQDIEADPNTLVADVRGKIPRSFELRVVNELGGRFRGTRTFVEDAMRNIPAFYEMVGQHVQGWVPPPPQVKRPDPSVAAEGNDDASEELQPTPPRKNPFAQFWS